MILDGQNWERRCETLDACNALYEAPVGYSFTPFLCRELARDAREDGISTNGLYWTLSSPEKMDEYSQKKVAAQWYSTIRTSPDKISSMDFIPMSQAHYTHVQANLAVSESRIEAMFQGSCVIISCLPLWPYDCLGGKGNYQVIAWNQQSRIMLPRSLPKPEPPCLLEDPSRPAPRAIVLELRSIALMVGWC